jgi:hypothetical protein
LFHPVFDEGIAQSVFGLRLGKKRAFDNETIFAHFFGRLSRVSEQENFTTKEK